MNIKLVATDMDGTLLDSQKRLPDDFESWVLSHPEIKMVIASGRQYYCLLRDFGPFSSHLSFVAENGSMVVDQGKIIYTSTMTKEDVCSVLSLVSKIQGVGIILCGIDSAYCVKEEKEGAKYYARLKQVSSFEEALEKDRILKIAVYFPDANVETLACHFDEVPSSVKGVISGACWVDFSNVHANKGVALKALMKADHIDKTEAMAFGDYLNDKEMLEAVCYSYAMANALDEVKKVCSYQTDSNDQDGVMKILRQL